MQFIEVFNLVVAGLFFLCYASYQFFYLLVSLFGRRKQHKEATQHRFAVLIAARNEENVIGILLDSLKKQYYPQELVDLYVVADNCTDKTAWVARAGGATVFERSNTEQVGKGYALAYLIEQIREHAAQSYDAYLIFDADNVVDPHFITEINKVFSDGCEIVTSYRNSKNYGDNWISAGNGLCYIRECRCLNYPRFILGSSSTITGTGYMISDKLLQEVGGWKYFLLTEDWELTADALLRDVRIGYAKDAIVYDEQTTSFSVSWTQRVRWCRGYLQVLRHYGGRLVRKVLRGSFPCYDLLMSILTVAVLSVLSLPVNAVTMAVSAFTGGSVATMLTSLGLLLLRFYLALLAFSLFTTLLEWKRIHCPAWKKLLYAFTFPLFMATYVPINVCSVFAKPKWKPIKHTKNVDLEHIESGK